MEELRAVTTLVRRRVLKGLARNPAAPDRMVHRLARAPWGAEEIARRREQMTEELATVLLETGGRESAVALGRNARLPVSVRRRLAAHTDAEVRATAARRFARTLIEPGYETPVGLLTELAGDPDPRVRSEVAAHSRTPDEVRTRLAADAVVKVRVAVATWWKAPPSEVHRTLLTDPDPAVRKAVCSPWHPVPPADLHLALLAVPETRPFVAQHITLTPAIALELARDPEEEVRAGVAGNPDLPQALRDELADDHNALVRHALLVSQHTPHETRIRLHEEVLAGAESDDEWFVVDALLGAAWMGHELRWLHRVSVEERLALLDSPLSFLRYGVASGVRDLPAAAVDRLLNDPDPHVQRITALCAASPSPAELERIVREHGDHRKVRPGILGRPDFPTQAYARFATAERAELRAAAAATALPAETLEALAVDVEPWVRSVAAGNPHLPLRCLPRLLADEQRDVAEQAGTSVLLPEKWMDALLTAEGL
ncbi:MULTISPECIES: hypothetical protein [unclassified Streptomyces]|uniref:hypothetical protein n=1 Tax=unclassified Streptomyces TaxID=2593676 RepID=UPI003807342D